MSERVPLLRHSGALPSNSNLLQPAAQQSAEEEEFISFDEGHGELSALSRVAASVGSCFVQFFPWVLLAIAVAETSAFSAACLLLFLWVLLSPMSFPTATSAAVPCRIFPTRTNVVASAIVSGCFVVLVIVYECLCALKPEATGGSLATMWRILGMQHCGPDKASGDSASRVAFTALWAPIVVLVLAGASFFFLRLLSPSRQRGAHAAYWELQSVREVDIWPKVLSPFFVFQFVMVRVFTVEWSVCISALFVASYRRCILSVPFLLLFGYCVIVGALKVSLYSFGRKKRPLVFSPPFYLIGFLYTAAVSIVYVAWRLSDEAQQTNDVSTLRRLFAGYNQRDVDNVGHCLLLGLLISVLGIARCISMTTQRIHTFSEVDELETAGEAKFEIVTTLRRNLFRIGVVLNPILLFVALNVGASLLGIVWVCLWILEITVLKAKQYVFKAIISWGSLHMLFMFVGGFEFISPSDKRWKIIGVRLDETLDTITMTALIVITLYNCFMWLWLSSEVTAVSRDSVIDVFAAAAKANDTDDSMRTEELGDEGQSEEEAAAAARSRRRTLTEFAVQRWTAVQYVVIKYFYILAFFGLFLAAIVRVNALHATFLVLFAIIVAWRPVPHMLWALLVIYTLILTMAIYSVHVAAQAETSGFLVTLGFLHPERSSWEAWPYFVWSTIFVVQFHVFRSRVQDQSFRWTQFIPVAERLLTSFICIVNCSLFAVVTCTQHVSIYGFAYLMFFLITTTTVMLTSLHSPGKIVRVYWGVVLFALGLMVTSVYLYTLFLPSVKDLVDRGLSCVGLTPQFLGIRIESRLGLWPSISSLLLCIVQNRVWNPGTTTDGSEEELAHLQVFVVLRKVVVRAVKLLEVYSLTIASLFLLIAALTCFCMFPRIAVINLAYFVMGWLVSTSKMVRSSDAFWVGLQMFSGALCLVQYVAEFPFWDGWPISDWQGYVGITLRSNPSGEMFQSLSPSLFVFAATAAHVYIRNQVHSEEIEDVAATPRSVRSMTARTLETLINQPVTESLYFILSHPMDYFDIAGYHVALLSLFVAAVLHIYSVLGPIYLVLALLVGATGRQGIRRFFRWTCLCIVLFLIMVLQYALLLGLPPGATMPFVFSSMVRDYLALSGSKFSTAVAVAVWIVANLERISLSRRIPLFHWFWGLPCGHGTAPPLSMTERQCRFQWRIAAARKHNAKEMLRRTIPIPKNDVDFTNEAIQTNGDKVKEAFYAHTPTFVLLIVFLHAVYDAASRLLLTKLLSLFLCLLFLQSLRELAWHGNHWWRWLLRFHILWLGLRMLFNVPFLQRVEAVACSLRYLGLEPSGRMLFDAGDTDWSCVGSRFSVFELGFHSAVICLLWIQFANYERAEYAFMLHRRFATDLESQSLGNTIRAERVRIIQKTKEANKQSMLHRQRLLEKVWVAHHATEDQSTALESPEILSSPVTPLRAVENNLQATTATVTDASPNLDDTSIEVLAGTCASVSIEPLTGRSSFRFPEIPKVLETSVESPAQAVESRQSSTERGAFFWSFVERWFALIDSTILWLDRNSINHPTQRVRILSGHRCVTFTLCVYRWIFSYTDRVCYFMFCVQFVMSPNLLSSFLPLSVFLYAAAMNPRPHRGYWSICRVYIQINMLLISVIKVWYCTGDYDTSSAKSIALFGRACSSDHYIVDMMLKLTCLMCVTLHTDHLRRWGLWEDRELETSSTPGEGAGFLSKVADAARNITRDDCKIGDDLYKVSLAFELLGFIYVFFAYYKLVGLGDTLVESLKHSILPGSLAVTLIVLFSFIVVDRIVYLNRSLLSKYIVNGIFALTYHGILVYWFVSESHNVNGQLAPFWLNGTLPLAIILYFLKANYLYLASVQVQRGYYEYTSHIVFSGTYGTGEYIVYYAGRLIPFLFELRVLLDWTVTKTTLKLPYFMKLEDLCHELYLLRADQEDTRLIDKAKNDDENLPYPERYKYPLGGTFFILLVFLLLFPLVLYSSFSPVAQTNSVSMLTASLSLEGFPPLWESSNQFLSTSGSSAPSPLNQTVVGLIERIRPSLGSLDFRTSTVQLLSTNNYSSSTWSISPPARQRILSVLRGNDTISFVLEVSIRSSATFSGSATSLLREQKVIDDEVRGNFTELLEGETASIQIPALFTPFLFNKPQNDFTPLGIPTDSQNTIDCFLAKSQGEDNDTMFFSAWCHTLFARSNPTGDGRWNDLAPSEWECLSSNNCPNYELVNQSSFGVSPVYFVVSSTAVLSAGILMSVGIVAAYTTFVFAIGRVLRFAFSGDAYRMSLQDLEDSTFVVNLIEYIFFVRAQGKFGLEKQVYKHLVDTIRVTERLERESRRGMHQ